jgi:hypothetical protein
MESVSGPSLLRIHVGFVKNGRFFVNGRKYGSLMDHDQGRPLIGASEVFRQE